MPDLRDIARALPFVCPRPHARRFPRMPDGGVCPDHLPTRVKVIDQSALIASWDDASPA